MKEQLEPHIEEYLKELENQINNVEIEEKEEYITNLLKIIEEINNKEEKLNELIKERNELQELKNQLRHIRKKSKAYNVKEYEQSLNVKYSKLSSKTLKRKISKLAKILVMLDENKQVGVWNRTILFFSFRKNINEIEQEGILMHLLLEDYYLTNLVEERERKLERENFEELKLDIKNLYLKKYIPISKKILNTEIKLNINTELMKKIFEKVELGKEQEVTEENPTPILGCSKNYLLELYPIVLTTVDSVISNYWSYFATNNKVDYIIIDESSQCDILSALPLLYLAKNIIIVGDEKQLSAITNIEEDKLESIVKDEYDYTKENFLSSISKTIKPASKMLLEHYRCDYSIINYCNKFFYENKLKIYNDSKKGAMSLINNDKGKYVEFDENGYKNLREIKCIDEQIEHDITGKFIITPFRRTSRYTKRKIWRKAMWNNTYIPRKRRKRSIFFICT